MQKIKLRLQAALAGTMNKFISKEFYLLSERVRILEAYIHELRQASWTVDQRIKTALSDQVFIPSMDDKPNLPDDTPFMQYSTVTAADMFHPRYYEICKMISDKPRFHRKQWEWVYIIHHLIKSEMVVSGKRGIAFGVGREQLPSLFASLGASITCTDSPSVIGTASGWDTNNQHSSSLDHLFYDYIVNKDIFYDQVSFQPCDMNNIDPTLNNFDFTWSSCCLEHLGSLNSGIEFIVNSVEKVLKVGGVACHTTELNLSSDVDTVEESPDTVLYRRKDILSLIKMLRERGHEVSTLAVSPDSHHFDFHVDTPPYSNAPHLKLKLAGYVTTSVGIVIKRGR